MKLRTTLHLVMVLALFVALLTNPVKTGGTAILAINPSIIEVPETKIGEMIQFNLTVTDVTNLWGWKVRLNWNPQVLNLTQIQEGPFLKNVGQTLFLWPYNSPTIREGYIPEIVCGLFQATGANGSGVLAIITFKVVAPGSSIISINETQLLEPGSPHKEIPHTVVNSEVTVIPEFTTIATIFPLLIIVTLYLASNSRRRTEIRRKDKEKSCHNITIHLIRVNG